MYAPLRCSPILYIKGTSIRLAAVQLSTGPRRLSIRAVTSLAQSRFTRRTILKGASPREQLLSQIHRLPRTGRVWVGFSGGLDSSWLLYTLAALRADLPFHVSAVHINHGLSPMAGQWAEQVRRICGHWRIPLEIIGISAQVPAGESIEAWARARRYAAFADLLQADEILLTAHHRDDQAETLILQLLRGAGPKGLAAMPFIRRLGAGWQARPLLGLSRESFRQDARAAGLRWIEDLSNTDTRFDRNFLRLEILPRLRERWPQLDRTLARAAGLQAQADAVLTDVANKVLAGIMDPQGLSLDIKGLLAIDEAVQGPTLRAWLGRQEIPIPDQGLLARIPNEVIAAAPDAQPRLAWLGGEIRRYRGRLYAARPRVRKDLAPVAWPAPTPLEIAGGLLSAEPVAGSGIAASVWDCSGRQPPAEVRFRLGGERIRPVGSPHSRTLKHLFQEAGVPPWERSCIPLIFIEKNMAAVAGYWVAEGYQAQSGEAGYRLHWRKSAL